MVNVRTITILAIVTSLSTAASGQISNADAEKIDAAYKLLSLYTAVKDSASWCKELPAVSAKTIDDAVAAWETENGALIRKAELVIAQSPGQRERLEANLTKMSAAGLELNRKMSVEQRASRCAEYSTHLPSLKERSDFRVLLNGS